MSGHRMAAGIPNWLGFQSPDAFERGQNLLAQAAQSYGLMGQKRTTTSRYKPGALDYLDMGVGYGLAGMKAYDMFKNWRRAENVATDPIGRVLGIFGSAKTKDKVAAPALSTRIATAPLKTALGLGAAGLGGFLAARRQRQDDGKTVGGGVKSGIMGGISGGFALGGPKGVAIGAGVGLLGYLLG